MNDLEKEIEKKKRIIQDYLRLSKKLKFDQETIERQTNLMLEDLAKLLKKRN